MLSLYKLCFKTMLLCSNFVTVTFGNASHAGILFVFVCRVNYFFRVLGDFGDFICFS